MLEYISYRLGHLNLAPESHQKVDPWPLQCSLQRRSSCSDHYIFWRAPLRCCPGSQIPIPWPLGCKPCFLFNSIWHRCSIFQTKISKNTYLMETFQKSTAGAVFYFINRCQLEHGVSLTVDIQQMFWHETHVF